MDRKDKKSKNNRKTKSSRKFVTMDQLDKALDRNIEDKFIDLTIDLIPLTSPAGATPNTREVSVVPEGTGPNELIGLKTRPKAVMGRFQYTGRPTDFNMNNATFVRVLIVQWTQDASEPPEVDDILQPVVGNDVHTLSYNNIGNAGKYRVLYNKIVELSNDDDSARFIQVDSFYYEFGKTAQHNRYDIAGGATTGHIYLVWFSNKEEILDAPFISAYIRYRYEDA